VTGMQGSGNSHKFNLKTAVPKVAIILGSVLLQIIIIEVNLFSSNCPPEQYIGTRALFKDRLQN